MCQLKASALRQPAVASLSMPVPALPAAGIT